MSAVPYEELNLGGAVGDDPAAVRANRELRRQVARARPGPGRLDEPGARARTSPWSTGPWGDGPEIPAVDAIVTARRGLALAVLTADCTPGPAGRPGRRGRGRRARGTARAWSPGSCPPPSRRWSSSAPTRPGSSPAPAPPSADAATRCPDAMRAEVAAVEPAAYAETSWGTPAVDVDRRGARAARRARGARPAAVAGLHAGVGRPLLVPPRPHHRAARRICLAGLMRA